VPEPQRAETFKARESGGKQLHRSELFI